MIEESHKGYFKRGSYLFIDINGSKVPFRIEGVEDNAHFIIKVEEVGEKSGSDNLSGKEICIPIGNVRSRHLKSTRHLRDAWDQYQIEDVETLIRYSIIKVTELPQQTMASIMVDQKELLIPLSEPLIESIDNEKKLIRMHIPEGLLDL
jgi:16S rRNA processing protein RimM